MNNFEKDEGLSKRELMKLQRLMKSDQINKAKNNSKGSKRKAQKGTNSEEPQPRKLNINEQVFVDTISEEKSISILSDAKIQMPPQKTQTVKKVLKSLKPFNPLFPVDGGEQGLFDYLLNYFYIQKQKQYDQQDEDLSFLDEIEGKQIEIYTEKPEMGAQKSISQKDELEKIKTPFDEIHKELLRKISSESKQN